MADWAVGITTAARPVDYLPATLRSLREAGWGEVTVFAEPSTPIPPGQPASVAQRHQGPWPSFLRCLSSLVATSPQAAAYGVWQDDTLTARNCRRWLEGQEPRSGISSLYISEHQSKDRPPGWSAFDLGDPANGPVKVPYGACAVVMPPDVARLLLTNPPEPQAIRMTDTWLGKFCQEAGLPFWQHVPSLVRHVGRESSLARKGKRPIIRPWVPARHEGEFVEDAAVLGPAGIPV